MRGVVHEAVLCTANGQQRSRCGKIGLPRVFKGKKCQLSIKKSVQKRADCQFRKIKYNVFKSLKM